MSACLLCPHYENEHDTPQLGSRCRARYYHGDGKDDDYERCGCPGLETEEEPDAQL